MKATFDTWKNRETVKIISGDAELIVGISEGPTTNFKVGDWCLYGGHRFTIAPENEESYFPDNDFCEVKINDLKLIISALVRRNKIRLSLEISATPDNAGFDLVHVLHNYGPDDWNGALWAITCGPRSAQIFAPCKNKDIHFWPDTDPHNWLHIDKHMTIKPDNFRGKAGWHDENAWLAAIQPQGTLIIHNPESTFAS
jgi:hypothetical protein